MDIFNGVPILLDHPPEIEFSGEIVYVTDRVGDCTIRRAYRRKTAILGFANFADKLREDRLGGAEIIEFPAAETA